MPIESPAATDPVPVQRPLVPPSGRGRATPGWSNAVRLRPMAPARDDAIVEPIWTADTRQCRRLIVPALAMPCLVGAFAYVLGDDVTGAVTDPTMLSLLVGGAALIGVFLRFVWWARVIARRSIAFDATHLAVLRPFGRPATIAWSAATQLQVCPGNKRPEWARFPSFAWFEALDHEGCVVFTSPDLFAVGDLELGRLAAALQQAAATYNTEVVVA